MLKRYGTLNVKDASNAKDALLQIPMIASSWFLDDNGILTRTVSAAGEARP